MANYLPYPKFKAFDFQGKPLSGGLLNVYEPGTTTRKTTYSDAALTTAHDNPLTLDSNGEAMVYYRGTVKLLLTTTTGTSTPFGTQDNVPGLFEESYKYYPDASEADQGAATAGGSLTIKDFIDAASGNPATIVLTHSEQGAATNYVFKTTEVVPSNIHLIVDKGAFIQDDASNADLTISGTLQRNGYTVFDWGNGSGTLSPGTIEYQSEHIVAGATSLDLSGAAVDQYVFHNNSGGNAYVNKATFLYTEASSGDAGITVKIGKESDDDWFFTGTTEISKSQFYTKDVTLLKNVLGDGDTLIFDSAGGKTGTGEIKLILEIHLL